MNHQFDELMPNLARSVTRRAALKRLGVGLGGVALTPFALRQAKAITKGELDGDAHRNVGGFVWLKSLWPGVPPPVIVGSGSLIHPRVVLFAGHGTLRIETEIAAGVMTIDDLRISFGNDATNPGTWRALAGVITHPAYAAQPWGNGNVPVPDVGVVILQTEETMLPVMSRPPVGFLDALQASGQLHEGSYGEEFTVVGYGSVSGDNPGHVPFPPDGLRRVTQSSFRKLHERWLVLDANPVHDQGGTASGDSGGPTLWVDPASSTETLVAITARGASASLDSKARVDTAEVLDFLDEVIQRVEEQEL